MKLKTFLAIFSVMGALSAPSFAQIPPVSSGNDPVEISAAGGLEWNRTAKTYTARGDVVAKKGQADIRSDTLTAFYSDADGGTDISKLSARGHVILSSPPYKAYGDDGVYDVKTGNAVLTGKDLRVETGTERLTARDKLEYTGVDNKMTAYGDATAVKEKETLRADRLTALFGKDAAGKMTVKDIEAEGNIVITTDKEQVTGDHGVYDVPAQKAVLTGKVVITQGANRLEGTRAVVDMTTGISQLFASDGSSQGGRVTGIFYPKAQQTDGKQ